MVGKFVNTAYIGIGSNIGDKVRNCEQAAAHIASDKILVERLSSFYSTRPVGYLNQPDFINGVMRVVTSLTPEELYAKMAETEERMGKNTPFKDGPRIIDLDLLIYNDLISLNESLTIPHPRMHLRKFVLDPLCEIAPALVHPTFDRTINDLKSELYTKEKNYECGF